MPNGANNVIKSCVCRRSLQVLVVCIALALSPPHHLPPPSDRPRTNFWAPRESSEKPQGGGRCRREGRRSAAAEGGRESGGRGKRADAGRWPRVFASSYVGMIGDGPGKE